MHTIWDVAVGIMTHFIVEWIASSSQLQRSYDCLDRQATYRVGSNACVPVWTGRQTHTYNSVKKQKGYNYWSKELLFHKYKCVSLYL